MKQILLTILGASIANILTFLLYQGFVKSWMGQQAREEITRWCNDLAQCFRWKK